METRWQPWNIVCELYSQGLNLILAEKIDINCELYSDSNVKIEKQLKYADVKQIPFVIIQGPDEVENNVVILKNLQTREQMTMPLEEAIAELRS